VITPNARRAIFDTIRLEEIQWWGGLDEIEFLSRLYTLEALPSHDPRYPSALGDIHTHRVSFDDWEDDWVFGDARFQLIDGPDEVLLRFLAQMVHPVIRPDAAQAGRYVEFFNEHLRPCGVELAEVSRIAGRPVYATRETSPFDNAGLDAASAIRPAVGTEYIGQQITRMQSAIRTDPELAIGTAKELVEAVAKAIADERHVAYLSSADLPQLVRLVARELRVTREDIPDDRPEAETIRQLLSNLATVSDRLAALRNRYGTGHADPSRTLLTPRHARLAVGAASTLAVFLWDTHCERRAEMPSA
jgi:hypothetical protein